MASTIRYSSHAVARMFERGISETDVRLILEKGELIFQYPEDRPFPSKVLLGWKMETPIHVVVADDVEHDISVVITTYIPDPKLWDDEFKRRRTS